MKQDKRFVRLFGILGQLSPHSQVTVRDLSAMYEVSERSIQRDINVLRDARLGVYCDDEKIKISRVGYRKIRSWMLG